MKKLAIALPVVLSACAGAVQIGPSAPDPDPVVIGQGTDYQAEIVIYRESEVGFIANVATAPEIFLGERRIGTCLTGKPYVLRLPAGNYTVRLRTGKTEENQWVVLSEGETVYLRCGTESGPSLSPAPILVREEAESARRAAGVGRIEGDQRAACPFR